MDELDLLAFCNGVNSEKDADKICKDLGLAVNAKPPTNFYTYALICGKTNRVFYVGKGKGKRVYTHSKSASLNKTNKEKNLLILDCKKSGFEISHVILSSHDKESDAYDFEHNVISSLDHTLITNIELTPKRIERSEKVSFLPSIYDYENTRDWAKECLSRVSGRENELTFMGQSSPDISRNILAIIFENLTKGFNIKTGVLNGPTN